MCLHAGTERWPFIFVLPVSYSDTSGYAPALSNSRVHSGAPKSFLSALPHLPETGAALRPPHCARHRLFLKLVAGPLFLLRFAMNFKSASVVLSQLCLSLCDLGQLTQPLWDSLSSSLKRRWPDISLRARLCCGADRDESDL